MGVINAALTVAVLAELADRADAWARDRAEEEFEAELAAERDEEEARESRGGVKRLGMDPEGAPDDDADGETFWD